MDDKIKKCKECEGEFPIETFPLDRKRPRPRCRDCYLKNKRKSGISCRKKNREAFLLKESQYREENRERIQQKHSEWIKGNKDKTKIYSKRHKKSWSEEKKQQQREKRKVYNKLNADKIREQRNKWRGSRKETDPVYVALERIRASIRNFIKNSAKLSRSLNYTGCSSVISFLEEMNKKSGNPNWIQDGYEIDHIWQIHWFSEYCSNNLDNIEKLAFLANNHSNLRPLRKELNQGRSRFDFSFITNESFSVMKEYLNEEISAKIDLFLRNRDLFSGDMIMKTSKEEKLILDFP